MPKQRTRINITLILLAILAALFMAQRRPEQITSTPKPEHPFAPSLFISVVELKARLQRQEDIILVDLRPATEFAKVHIPDSINIPLYLLKTKGHLKAQAVVLINEGYARHELEEECQRLQPLGFSQLAILSGGLTAWQQSGAPLMGDPFAAQKLAIVPARVFFQEAPSDHRLVIDITPPQTGDQGAIIPGAVSLADDGGQGVTDQLQRHLADQDAAQPQSVLLANNNGQGYEAIGQRLRAAGLGPIFYLEGGRQGYQAFKASQALLRQPEKLATDNKTCPTCP